MNQRMTKVAVCFILAVALALSTCACTSPVNPGETTASAATESRKYLSESALIQQIALAVNGSIDSVTVFNNIPDRQHDKISADQFQRYIKLLRRGVIGKVVSFAAMTDADLAVMREQVLSRMPAQNDLATRTMGYWLNIGDNGIAVDQLAIYCQRNEEGNAYLDSSWMEQILKITDFYNLYFDAIDQRDTEALDELLRPTVPENEARAAIARSLSWFYRYQVETETSEFRMLSARIDGISFAETLVSAISPVNTSNREIEFVPQLDGTITVNDFLPSELEQDDMVIKQGDDVLFRVGGDPKSSQYTVYSSPLENKIGKPVLHDDTTCVLQENGKSLIQLNYASMDLTIEGTCNSTHTRWYGRVLSVTLKSPDYNLGAGLKVGEPAEKLYAQYPFISVGNRSATVKLNGSEVELKASVSDGFITALRLTVNTPFTATSQ